MKPKPFPKTQGDAWRVWPTLHRLQQAQPELTITQFRGLLRDVPSYRCEDNTVRYDPELATAALAPEIVDGLDDADDLDEPSNDNGGPRGEALTLMALYREQTRASAEQRKDHREQIITMGGPLKLGIELVNTLTGRLETRLDHLEKNWDKVCLLIEDLMDRQSERERDSRRETLSSDFKRKSFTLVEKHAPVIVEKWSLNAKATSAIEFLESLDPQLFAVAESQGWLTPAQAALLARLRPTAPSNDTVKPTADVNPADPPGNHSS
jgi:hypothetical protein